MTAILIEAARALCAQAEEYELADGVMLAAPLDLWHALMDAIEAAEKAEPVEICVIGLHASRRPWRALQYAPTPEMLATTSWPGCAATDYAHMLAAAPQPLSAQARAATQCRCTLVQQSVGDGCEVCNPKLAQRLADEAQASVPEEPR